MELPLFPLHTVLYPGQALRLHVFEERYRRMMADVLPDGPFAVAAIRAGREVGGPYEPFPVGVEVRVVEFHRHDDGRVELEAAASGRLRLVRRLADEPYPRWEVEPFPEADRGSEDLVARAAAAARRYLAAVGAPPGALQVPDDHVTASYALARVVPGLVPDRQSFLEVPGAGERLRLAAAALAREAGILEAIHRRREGGGPGGPGGP